VVLPRVFRLFFHDLHAPGAEVWASTSAGPGPWPAGCPRAASPARPVTRSTGPCDPWRCSAASTTR
jgi:hypothetical protein